MNAWLERNQPLVLGLSGLLVAIAAVTLALRIQKPEPIIIEPPAPTATAGPIQVYVSGAVAAPGVYALPAGSITEDAIATAGGTLTEANLNAINLASSLSDGMQVHVPLEGEVSAPATAPDAGGAESAAIAYPLNINTASAADLETLPGIGPALAGRIVDYRETYGAFASIEAIQNVSGIGPATFEGFQDLITVD